MLASAILSEISKLDYEVLALDVDKLDICYKDDIERVIIPFKPDIVINCAAYTNVDGAETEQNQAYHQGHYPEWRDIYSLPQDLSILKRECPTIPQESIQ